MAMEREEVRAMDEAHALRAMRRGDQNALGWLIERYTPYVSAIIGSILSASPTADIEELASDVFVSLWTHADEVRPDALRAWLGAVARNKARNRLRTVRPESPLEDDVLTLSDDSLQQEAEQRELYRAVQTAVLQLQQPDREIFLRHYYYYQPVAEIGAQMNMNESTVKSRLRRGREKLKTMLIQGGFADEMHSE
jgi:RNA polymerase sigma-70 factor (ECF subfamily)